MTDQTGTTGPPDYPDTPGRCYARALEQFSHGEWASAIPLAILATVSYDTYDRAIEVIRQERRTFFQQAAESSLGEQFGAD